MHLHVRQAYVTQYHRHKLRRRLVGLVLCLAATTLPQAA
jgi:hypothetical protein